MGFRWSRVQIPPARPASHRADMEQQQQPQQIRITLDDNVAQGEYINFANIIHSPRSEEHTSELQSQSNLVCRLLLEKKKTLTPHIKPHYDNPLFHHITHWVMFKFCGFHIHVCRIYNLRTLFMSLLSLRYDNLTCIHL